MNIKISIDRDNYLSEYIQRNKDTFKNLYTDG